jgi:hypothetical protein
VDLCPLIEQKTKKNWEILEKLGFGECWKKNVKSDFLVAGGGYGWWGMAGGGVSVVGKVAVGGGCG